MAIIIAHIRYDIMIDDVFLINVNVYDISL